MRERQSMGGLLRRVVKQVWSFPCAGGVVAIALLGNPGCASKNSLYLDIQDARRHAYQQWLHARESEQERKAHIEGKLTLEDAIKLALTYNKSLLAVIEEKEIARGRVVESYSEVLPKLSAVGNYTRLDKLSGFDVAGRSITIGELDNYSVDLQVRQPIFRGGAISAAIRAAQIYSYLADETVRGQVQATIFDVASNYYDTLLAQQLYEVNRAAVVSARAHLKDVETKLSQGVASRFDVLRAEVDVSNFRAEMIQQQNRLHLAKTRLLKAMGVSQETQIELADELSYEPTRPVFEEAVRISHLNRPDLYGAELGVRLQQEAVRIARSQYWPKVDARFTQGWARPDPHTSADEWDDRWVAGVQVEMPIFDGLRREGRLVQEKAALARRKIELMDAEERALLEIQQAILSLRDAEEFAESQRLNLQRAQEGLRLAEVGYREGVNTAVEVVDARAALTRTRGLYYQAIHAHTMARLALQRAMGILGPRAADRTVPKKSPVQPAHIKEFELTGRPGTQPPTESVDVPVPVVENKGVRE